MRLREIKQQVDDERGMCHDTHDAWNDEALLSVQSFAFFSLDYGAGDFGALVTGFTLATLVMWEPKAELDTLL